MFDLKSRHRETKYIIRFYKLTTNYVLFGTYTGKGTNKYANA